MTEDNRDLSKPHNFREFVVLCMLYVLIILILTSISLLGVVVSKEPLIKLFFIIFFMIAMIFPVGFLKEASAIIYAAVCQKYQDKEP
ncbi:MAG: hypothetical protein ACXAEL_14005 [Candidatus Hodarchaeales archaeon]|jgi:hypothetical protein